MQNLLSLKSRKIFINKIDLTLNVDSIEFPDQKLLLKNSCYNKLYNDIDFNNINFDDKLFNDCVNTIGGTILVKSYCSFY